MPWISPNSDFEQAQQPIREKLEAASALHWIHWLIVVVSLLMTFFAWNYANSQKESRVSAQFDREVEQVVSWAKERMLKYEDALWSGVALIHASGEEIELEQWKAYAESIDIPRKYPGINGIGVIHVVPGNEVDDYLRHQRERRPEFSIHPTHPGDEHFPISYIIPFEGNEKAVGLDMAHEVNRYTAAKRARDTGKAQVTAPITLVQDSGGTPGFLFYAPFYKGNGTEPSARPFAGMVYAPFVVKKLMDGGLGKDKRQVGVRLSDGQDVIYDEHRRDEVDFDETPLYTESIDVPMYGRNWTFDIRSTKSFRKATTDNQPLVILIGGVLIDSLIVSIFLLMSRTSRTALRYAKSMNIELEENYDRVSSEVQQRQRAEAELLELNASLNESRANLQQSLEELKRSNAELEQFAYVASHDLQEPLRKIASYAQIIREEYGERLDDAGHEYLDVVADGAKRLRGLVNDLLSFSRITTRGKPLHVTETDAAVQAALERLELQIDEHNALISIEQLPQVLADAGQLAIVFQNLIGNAIKYRGDTAPLIRIGYKDLGAEVEISVADNGIGIDSQFHHRIFDIFQQLHNRRDYSGSGIGLAIAKRIIERFGGVIRVESTLDEGSTFFFTLSKITEEHTDVRSSTESLCASV